VVNDKQTEHSFSLATFYCKTRLRHWELCATCIWGHAKRSLTWMFVLPACFQSVHKISLWLFYCKLCNRLSWVSRIGTESTSKWWLWWFLL